MNDGAGRGPMGPDGSAATCRDEPSDAEIDRAVREFTREASRADFRFIRREVPVRARVLSRSHATFVFYYSHPSSVPFFPPYVAPHDFVAIGPA